MAALHLAPIDDAWDRAAALGRIARGLLAMRIVVCLLVSVWCVLTPHPSSAVAALFALSLGLLLFLLRWRTVGVVLSTHPVVLALDAAVGFYIVAQSDPPDPSLLVVGTAALLTGVCLGRTGVWYFAPLFVAVWWFIYTVRLPQDASGPDLFNALVLIPGLLAGVMVAGVVIRTATLEAVENEREMRQQVRSAGVAEERARLAREMHDSLVKSLHGVALMADALPRWIDQAPSRAKEQAVTIAELINRSSKESRDLIVAMRRTPAHATVAAMVRGVSERWAESTARRAQVRVVGAPELSAESTYELSAILSEALENVARHTPAGAAVEVTLVAEEAWVQLSVVDHGGGPAADVGPDLRREGHFGVLGMGERAARVGGDARVLVRAGDGVTVEVRMPAREGAGEPVEQGVDR